MLVEKIVVGELKENCYLLIIKDKCIIVDPGAEAAKIENKIDDLNLKICAILITHAHYDHIGALDSLEKKYNVKIYYHNINNEINKQNLINVEEKKYEIEDFKFEVIYTPGHRNDLVTYYFYEETIMFTGDFLFKGVIGRTDLEYSSFNDMKKSLIKIYKYSDDIIIYPGHGESSNMKNEKNNNYYLGVYNEK